MNPPPPELDGAKVLLWAPLTKANTMTGLVRLFADGKQQTEFAALALAQYVEMQNSGVYLFYCDGSWEVENDSQYRDFDDAKNQAERQFTGLADGWLSP